MAKGLIVDSGLYLPSDPQAAGFTSLVQSFGGGVADETGFGQNVYAGFQILQQIADQVQGDLTASTLMAAANKATNLNVSLLPKPLSYSTPNPVKGYERLTNMWVLGYTWDGTTYVPLTGSAALVNAQPALQTFVSGS